MRLAIAVLVVLTAVTALRAQEGADRAGSPDPGGVAAAVDDEMILWREVLERIGPELGRRDDPRERARLADKQIRQLIRHALQMKGARRLGYEVRDQAIDRAVAEEEKRHEDRGQSLDEVLAEQGKSRATYREDLRQTILVSEFRRTVAGRAAMIHESTRPRHDSFVRPKEIQEYYRDHRVEFLQEDRVRIRTIFFKTADHLVVGGDPTDARRQALDQAKEIRSRIERGENFATLAREFSRDEFDEKGGDRGLRERKGLPEFLGSWAFGASPGSVSSPLETPAGWVIARLEERTRASVRPFEAVQEAIRRRLEDRRQERNIARAILDLLEESDVTPARYEDEIRQDLLTQIKGL